MAFGRKRGKAIKDQFVLTVGDEGAIFCYFSKGVLANKIFIDSPVSADIKLIEKLLDAYPNTPVYMLVDVIEQNYSQQVLPPVSAFGIRQQIQRRIKRDFQPNDFTNVFFLNRSTEGRKDWNFLFVSLANSDPFAKWLAVLLNHNNPFKGVYLLPMESGKLVFDINKTILESSNEEWELLVIHNKVGGFRIVAFKNGKLIFTRLAQNLIGDNIPEIIVGNMEQEISNTVEYLKRLTFKGEAESKITIIAGPDILKKIEVNALKFGAVHLFTPFEVVEKLSLPQSVTNKDKFADILLATHFASNGKHVLKFNSPFTKKLDSIYNLIRGAYILFAMLVLLFIGLIGKELVELNSESQEMESVTANLNQLKIKAQKLKKEKNNLSKAHADIDKLLDIMSISNMFPEDKYRLLRVINKITPQFNERRTVDSLEMTTSTAEQNKKTVYRFQLDIGMKFIIEEVEKDDFNRIKESFLNDFSKMMGPKYKVVYSQEPKIEQSQFEKVTGGENLAHKDMVNVPAKITVSGEL